MVASAALLLSGCDQVKKVLGGGKPSGQVVATVDGEEITSLQLRSELGGFGSRDPKVMKAAQQQALERIILRKMLAKAARKEKLDKSADFTLQVERGEETLLAQLYQRRMAAKMTQPSQQAAADFVASHPDQFANRKVYFVDQVIAGPNKIPPDRFRPLKSLEEVKALLDSENVPYQEGASVVDTLTVNPQMVTAINNLPPGEVFVVPQGNALLFNQITGSHSAPFGGELAKNYAMNILRRQAAQELVAKRTMDMRKAAESKIVYNAAFKPAPPSATALAPKPPVAAPPAAPATAPAATPEAK
jgi:EpsD family peptidyl-prolyl cis-trans isomerase